MQNKGLIRIVAILLGIACIWQLSFTAVTRIQEKKAAKIAAVKAEQYATLNNVSPEVREFVIDSVAAIRSRAYVDSINTEKVYLWYTFKEVKEKEKNRYEVFFHTGSLHQRNMICNDQPFTLPSVTPPTMKRLSSKESAPASRET